jgi:hypothetical protein
LLRQNFLEHLVAGAELLHRTIAEEKDVIDGVQRCWAMSHNQHDATALPHTPDCEI